MTAISFTTLLLAATEDVGLQGILPSVSATPVHHAAGRRSISNAYGVKTFSTRSEDSWQQEQDVEEGDSETLDVSPSLIYVEQPEHDAVSDQLHGPIYVIAAAHNSNWNLDTRAANQSTKNMGADYVKLEQTYHGGYIVLSVIIAFVGSLCTLELLLRRTSNRGLYNVLLLFAAGVCFGSVSTFSMHFIGNNSLTLHYPHEVELNRKPFSLTYEAGWTVLSLVVSCAVTILAFFVMGLEGDYVQDFFGLVQPKSEDGSTSEEEDEDDPETRNAAVVTDLSLKEKKPSKRRMLEQKLGHRHAGKVSDKLKRALDPNRHETHELANRKSQTIEKDFGREDLKHEPVIPVVIKPPPSDPVASGYDNLPIDPASLDSLNVEPYDPTLRRASIASIRADILPEISPINNAASERTTTAPKTTPFWQSQEHPELRSTGHRASLPHLFQPTLAGRDYRRPSTNLSRIQSLPEAYPDETMAQGYPTETVPGPQHEMNSSTTEIRRRTSQSSHTLNDRNTTEQGDMDAFQDSPTSSDTYAELRKRRHGRRHRKRECVRASRLRRRLGLDVVTVEDVVKIFVSGAIAGIGIAGMHYIGQVSISNIGLIRYSMGTIVGSVFIACVAVIIGLYIMFIVMRPKLKHGWITKVGVACVLASAVCAMHYTAMCGAEYGLWKGERPGAAFRFNTQRLIIGLVSSLAFVACLSIFGFTIFARFRIAAHRRGRRRVVVATMIYDNEGRLLVASDGVIPMCEIAHLYGDSRKSSFGRSQRSNSTATWESGSDISSILDVDLSVSHPTFIAALRSTWAWRQAGVYPAGPGNAIPRNQPGDFTRASDDLNHAGSTARRISVLSIAESASYPGASDSSRPLAMNVARFLDRFQYAVAQLANTVIGSEQSVRRLGVLYDRILTTGHVRLLTGEGRRYATTSGQLIFLVRRVTTAHEKSQLLARNYLFADISSVAAVMADVLAVPVEDFIDVMEDQQTFCDYGMTSTAKIGKVYVAASIIRPTTFDGIHICVERHRRHQLPMRELCKVYPVHSAVRSHISHSSSTSTDNGVSGSIEEIGEALAGLEGQTLFDMIAPKNMLLEEESLIPEDPSTAKLRVSVVNAMIPLLDMICTSKEMARMLPRLQITPYLVPITPPIAVAIKAGVAQIPEIQSAAQMAWMIYFQAVLSADDDYPDLDWEPWTLFKAQSECVARDGRQSLQAIRHAFLQSRAPSINTTARRPSKVQFSAFTAPSSHQASSVTEAPSILVNPDNRDALQQFESFAFPPSTSASASHGTDSGAHSSTDVIPEPIISRRSGQLAFDPFTPASRRQTSHGGQDDLGIMELNVESSTKNALHGVGFYNQDWLSQLVREDMLHRSTNATFRRSLVALHGKLQPGSLSTVSPKVNEAVQIHTKKDINYKYAGVKIIRTPIP
ncbi:hypothetical protein QFC22_001544 [Naganishia vaughanmartiniae]|uniref:Uncharacterized protein n=1 Tax=Naganishia vaughanmartiniae TaxID=1424756 RepID=A0ACC2XIX9_9TREE|nr:hypothetical protein QFC22_001544 [Naganishia vaughanmartiniae]